MTFDERLNWNTHCDLVVKNASKQLYVLRVLKNVVSHDQLVTVFNAIVRSRLEYASPLLVGLSSENSKKLERVQRRFHRLLCAGKECQEECLPSLSTRRLAAAMKLFRQCTNTTHALHFLLPRQSTTGRFLLPVTSTTLRLNSFFVFMIVHVNNVHTS